MNTSLLLPIALIALIIFIVVICVMGYVKAAPSEAIIISGLKSTQRTLVGRAGIRIPFLERKDKLTLALIQIDVKTENPVPTADFININVNANVNVQIGNTPEMLKLASRNFLNKNSEYIKTIACEVLEGNLREIVGRTRLEEMVSDRQRVADQVRANAKPDLAAMGLDIINFNIQHFIDDNKVIENLGVDNVVKITKAAAISRAESERDIKVAKAKADKESNDAEVLAQTEIAMKQNELTIKKSELQMEADTKRAMADAAYEIQKEEQRKTIEVTKANADIARQERETELKKKEAEVKEQSLRADVEKVADANKYKIEKEAEANLTQQKKLAEAKRYQTEKEAEAAKLKAEADRYAKEQEAAGIKAVGEAEAAAIQAKGVAEAEAMEKKAEAYAKYNNAAIMQMVIEKLPEMAHEVASPLQKIGNITIVDSGNGGSGIDAVSGYTPAALRQVMESVKATTGFDLMDVMKANTYAAKTDRNVTVTGKDVMLQAAVESTESMPNLAPESIVVGEAASAEAAQRLTGQFKGNVSGPRFNGDHDHVQDGNGLPVHG